jgi:hypothetical protein
MSSVSTSKKAVKADRDLLIRIDERVDRLIEDIRELKTSFVTQEEHNDLKKEVATKVSQVDYDPVKRIVYGAVALALVSMGGSIYSLLIR